MSSMKSLDIQREKCEEFMYQKSRKIKLSELKSEMCKEMFAINGNTEKVFWSTKKHKQKR